MGLPCATDFRARINLTWGEVCVLVFAILNVLNRQIQTILFEKGCTACLPCMDCVIMCLFEIQWKSRIYAQCYKPLPGEG